MQAKKEKIKLAIIYGGPGGEHEVSVRSAKNILNDIDKSKYEVKEIFLTKNVKIISKKIIIELKHYFVWPIFHGEFGEGGYVQEVLEKNKIKFIGSGSASSKLAIDKFKTQKLLEKSKILCPQTYLISKTQDFGKIKLKENLNFPMILKPVNSGSSVGLKKAKHHEEVHIHLGELFKNHKQILLQEFISGREFTCGVVNINKKTLALPVSEVVLNGQDVFDYDAKYATQGIEITPAKIDEKLKVRIQKLGAKVHKLVGCVDYSRTDMILDKKGKLYVLEINTIPGMTKVSFIPEQLKCQGINIPEFIDTVVKNHM